MHEPISRNGEPLSPGDVVRCYSLPTRRKPFRHATILRIDGKGRLRVRFDRMREAWTTGAACEGPLQNLKFRWRYGRKVPV